VTYTVVIATSNPELQLRPGMTANVRIVTDRRDNVLKVPNAALRFRPPAAATVVGAGAAGAAPAPAAGNAARGQALQRRLVSELQLTAEQQAKLESILAAQKGRLSGMAGLPAAERAKAAQRSRAELRERLAEILDAEQKARLPGVLGEPGAAAQGGTRGRVHQPGENGTLRAVDLRLGVSDGTMTEVLAGPLQEGDEVIIGSGAAARPAGKGPGPMPF
jgi:HlyD family secretion protein